MMNSNIQNYIDLVRKNELPACKEQILLCSFVLKIFASEDIYVNEIQLEKYLSLQKYFPFKLFEWEIFCFTLHNCVYRADGQLRFPNLLILVGRGAGKNGYLSFEDFALLSQYNNVKYYDIDICANNEEQAKTTFFDIYNVLEDNKKKLSSHFYWNKEVITNLKTRSTLRFRTSNAKTKDGGRPGKVDFDEYHAYENYDSINVFKTGLGKKAFPRTTITTTNGDVRGGPLDETIAIAEQILNGDIPDNGLLPFICKLDNEKEVNEPKNWHKANPSLRYLPILKEEMLSEYRDYAQNNIGNSAFMTKRMNIPVGNKEVEITSWENILATNQKIPDLDGLPCVFGIDYAMTTDFVAVGLLFLMNGIYYWLSHSFVCINGRDLSRIKYPLKEAQSQGLLTFIDDVEISPYHVTDWLAQMALKYQIICGAMDLFRHTWISKALKEIGYVTNKKDGNVKLIRPSSQMLISPILNSLFVNHKIIWGDNSLMRWYTNNTKQILDTRGNVSYGKIESKSRKTDGFMALVAAMCCNDILEGYDNSNFDVNLGGVRAY